MQFVKNAIAIWRDMRDNIRIVYVKGAIMDDTDTGLLSELRRDGRASLSDLATRLGLSRATVRIRIERLQQRGDIAGFTVVTRADAGPAPVRGLMLIGIEGRGAERIMARLSGFAAVTAVHSTNGKWDLIADLAAQTLEELDSVMFRIREIDGVMQSETNLILSTRRAGKR